MTLEHKQTQGFEWKAETEGSFRAVIATFNVRDSDGDVTRPGSFPEGKAIRISAWGHSSWSDALPIGKGTISQDEKRAWVDGQLFIDTRHGRDHYEVIKGLGPLQEWSYGFQPKRVSFGEFEERDVRFLEELEVFEAAPVLVGAGIGTRTESIKNFKRAVASHSTATSEGTWDGPGNEARLSNDSGASTYRRAFAWQDPDGDPDTKTAWRFIHHEVASGGAVSAANLVACSTGIGVLNGGRGGTTIPDGDRSGVYAHLARHLRDGDREPPELRAYQPDLELTLAEYEGMLTELKRGARLSQNTLGQLRRIRELIAAIEEGVDIEDGDDGKAHVHPLVEGHLRQMAIVRD